MSPQNLDFQTLSDMIDGKIKPPPPPEKPKKKTKAQLLKEKEAMQGPPSSILSTNTMSDDELVDHPPPPTFYNTWEGSIFIGGKKYHHKDLAFGKLVDAPPLTHEEWAARHEIFPYFVRVKDPKSGEWIREKQYLPARLNKLDKQIHDAIDKNPKILIKIFRGSHKSTVLQRHAKRRIGDYHESITYFSYSSDQVTEYSMEIKDQFSKTPSMLRTYGYIIDDDRMKQVKKMFWIPYPGQRISTRQAGLSVGSTQGMQRTGGHPDDIYIDDPESEDIQDSDKELKNLLRWFTKQIMPMMTSGTRMVIAGTPKDPHDLLNFIEREMGTFQVLTIRAIEAWPNGQTEPCDQPLPGKWYYVWNKRFDALRAEVSGVAGIKNGEVGMETFREEYWDRPGRVQYWLDDDPTRGYDLVRMSLQEFLLIRKEIGVDAFESEYQMNAVNVKAGYLGFQHLRMFTWDSIDYPTPKQVFGNCCAFFDQAFGDSNFADKNCIAVLGEFEDNYYILDLLVWRGGNVFTKIEMVKYMYNHHPQIQIFGIEADETNAEDVRTMIEYLPDLPIEPIHQNRRTDEDSTEDGIHLAKVVIANMTEIPVAKRSKVMRIINQFSSTLPAGKMWMLQGIGRDQIEIITKMGDKWINPLDEFKLQWSFPFCKKFDVIDAIGSAKEICQKNAGGLKGMIWNNI